jgi:hypothetical protein
MAEEDANWRDWLAAAQQGDRRAYAALLSAALPWLRSHARARWPRSSPADIEDIVQETLLALHRSLDLYEPSRPVAPFLFGILKLRGADVGPPPPPPAGRANKFEGMAVNTPPRPTSPGGAARDSTSRRSVSCVSPSEKPSNSRASSRARSMPAAASCAEASASRVRIGMGSYASAASRAA